MLKDLNNINNIIVFGNNMKKIILMCVLFIFLTSSISSSGAEILKNKSKEELGSLDEKNYYALIIGIEEYLGIPTPEQQYLDDSAIAIYEKLLNSSNWEKENILLLLNENATKEKIFDAITVWLNDKETKDDIVLIYIATHGWKTKLSQKIYGNAYFITYNSSDYQYDKETKITDKEFDKWLDVLDSKHIALILENCYSGKMLALRQSGRAIIAGGGRYIFCPCNWSIYLEDSIFGFFLRQGLTGVADINNDKWITVREAFHYLRFPVIWHSMWYHFPYIYKTGYGLSFVGPQVPYLYDRHIGEIPLIKYKE